MKFLTFAVIMAIALMAAGQLALAAGDAAKGKQVYTVNGFPDLAAHLRKLGYPAVHLDGKGQPSDAGHQMKLI